MNIYKIEVSAYCPYKLKFEYTDRARGFGTAIRRAVEKFRREERIKGKHLDNIQVSCGRAISSL